MADRTIVLLKQAQKGDAKAKELLVQENLGLVWSIVHRFANRGYEQEDLFQIGSIGLIKAIDRFDSQYEVKFSTYAVPMISGEIRRFLRDDSMIKISRSVKENYWKIQQAMQILQKQDCQDLTLCQVAEWTGLTSEEILLAMEAPMEVESLNKPVLGAEGKTVTLEERIPCQTDEKEQIHNRLLLEGMIKGLDSRERRLIYLRYFQDCTQSAAAKQLNMTQVQVSRLERKILKSLRENFE